MGSFPRRSFLAGAMAAACNPSSEAREPVARPPARSSGGSVLVELYTSQGCSSCPPADALLSELGQDPRVVPLAFHVDYWDRLGWPDPHGSREWSKRQRDHAASTRARQVYTPQLLFNGVDRRVGRKTDAALRAIADAAEPAFELELAATRDGDSFEVAVAVQQRAETASERLRVWLASFESGITTRITRGENAGRRLTNDFIVRDLRELCSIGDDASTSCELSLPVAERSANGGFAAFVQDPVTMEVFGATRIAAPQESESAALHSRG